MRTTKTDSFFTDNQKKLLDVAFHLNILAWIYLAFSLVSFGLGVWSFFINNLSQMGAASWEVIRFEMRVLLMNVIFTLIPSLLNGLIGWGLMRAMSFMLKMVVETDVNKRQMQDETSENCGGDVLLVTENQQNIEESAEVEQTLSKEPAFYEPEKVMRLSHLLDKGIWLAIFISVGLNATSIPSLFRVLSTFSGFGEGNNVTVLITVVAVIFILTANTLYLYLPIKAFKTLMPIIMEMEFNSRDA